MLITKKMSKNNFECCLFFCYFFRDNPKCGICGRENCKDIFLPDVKIIAIHSLISIIHNVKYNAFIFIII